MSAPLFMGQEPETAWGYLVQARTRYTQTHIAQWLGVDIRTVSRWEVRQSSIKPYLVPALQQLLR